MKSIIQTLQKSVTRTFYVEHIVLFLLFAFVMFGVFRGAEHLAIASFFTSSTVTLLIPMAFWALVSIRVILFNRQLTRRPEYQFLWQLRGLPYRTLFMRFVPVVACQLAPFISYGIFLITIATRNGNNAGALLLFSSLVLITAMTTHFSIWPYSRYHTPAAQPALSVGGLRKWRMPHFLFYPAWFIHSEWIVYLICLIVSMLIVEGISYLYLFDVYDTRFYALATWAAAGVMFQCELARIRYDFVSFQLPRFLPIPVARHFFEKIFTTALLLLPIMLVLLHKRPPQVTIGACAEMILLLIALPVFWHTLLLVRAEPPEVLLPNVLFTGLLAFILIMSKISLTLLSVILILTAFLIFRTYHNRYERVPLENLP